MEKEAKGEEKRKRRFKDGLEKKRRFTRQQPASFEDAGVQNECKNAQKICSDTKKFWSPKMFQEVKHMLKMEV